MVVGSRPVLPFRILPVSGVSEVESGLLVALVRPVSAFGVAEGIGGRCVADTDTGRGLF